MRDGSGLNLDSSVRNVLKLIFFRDIKEGDVIGFGDLLKGKRGVRDNFLGFYCIWCLNRG